MNYKRELDTMINKVGGKFVIMKGKRFFYLNETAARIYELCDGSRSNDDITRKIAIHFGVNRDEISDDIKEYLHNLTILGILKKVAD